MMLSTKSHLNKLREVGFIEGLFDAVGRFTFFVLPWMYFFEWVQVETGESLSALCECTDETSFKACHAVLFFN